MNLGPTSNLTPAGWSSVDSGRPVAILPHPTIPTTVYVATSGGGVFRCTNAQLDGGDWVWTPITDNLPANSSSGNVALGALAMSPTDSNVLYLGAGDFFDAEGRGFFRSTDAGVTWTAAAGLGAATRSFAILPLTATRIFWATNDGLKVSIDGGVSFAAVAGGPSTGNIWSIQKFNNLDLVCSKEITDANNNTISTIYTSADSGATWTAAALPANLGFTPGRITLVASLNNTVYGMVENTSSNNVIGRGVLKSTDKGVTWTWMAAPTVVGGLFQGTGRQMTSDGGQGWYNHGLAVDPTNANRLVMGSNLAMYRSTDGGASWTQLSHWFGNLHPYSHADFHTGAWSGGTLFMGNDGGISILRDPWRVTVPSGEDITFIDNRRNKGLPSHLVYHLGSTIAAAPADSRWRITLGMQDNGTRVRQGSDDALKASSVFEDQIGGDGFGTLIHATNGNLMLGSVYYSRVCKSTDGGATFIESTAGITEANDSANAPFKTRLMPGPANEPDTVYTFANKKVYRSTDFGNNWNALTMTDFVNSGKVIRNLAGSRRSNAVALASSGGQFWVSTNDGTTWTTSGDITAGSYNTSYVWFNTENDQILYGATVAPNANAHHLFRSSSGGTNWTPIDGSSAASNGLPFGIPIHVVQNLPGSLNTLFVGTDFGVYRSTNGGDTWTRFGEGLPLVGVRDLYLAPDGSFIRIATFGRGVWEAALTATGAPLDANGDGKVDPYDLLELLKRYGSTDAADLAKADFNGDSAINDADLTLLLAAL